MTTRMGLRMIAALGVALLLSDETRLNGSSYDTIQTLLPVQVWGLLFLTGAAVCLVARHHKWGPFLIGIGAGVHAWWCCAFLLAATRFGDAALTPIAVYAWTTAFHLLTAYRLARLQPLTRNRRL